LRVKISEAKTVSDLITIDETYAEAEVYKDILTKSHTHMYLVKVSLVDVGMYMTGITVQPSPKRPEDGLWVQPPRYQPRKGGKWVTPVELDTNKPLWELIEKMARKAVADYTGGSKDEVYWPTDDELNDIEGTVSKGIDDFLNSQPP
jgi:hypothetical protein